MALRRNGAALRDVLMELSREEYGGHDAATRGATAKPIGGVCITHGAKGESRNVHVANVHVHEHFAPRHRRVNFILAT